MDLTRVSWGTAAIELHDEHRRRPTAKTRRALASVLSLRARFTDDFVVATASTTAAIELEPLDPLHRVRDALARLRFGDLDGALDQLEELGGGVADLPLVLVVKALATARRGEPRIARNIADRALQADPHNAGARFLHTETNLAAQVKGGLDKLATLPRGERHDAAWADLLAKLAIVRPGEHRAVTQQLDRGVIARASPSDTLARTIATWSRATLEDLIAAAEAQPAGSRAEQLALGLALARATAALPVIAALRALHRRAADRPAVRRALVAAITRHAVNEAAAEHWPDALRAIQMCIELEPAEPAHHQNRAVLFTLTGEHDAALDAWAELDRVHYVSALLGRLDPASARRYAAPHRMFAQTARLGRSGIFQLEPRDGGGQELTVHQELIDRDPELLRHWLHHARAALVFELVSLDGAFGLAGDHVLLAPATPAIALARAEGLAALAQSLAVLVPEDGHRLAELLRARLRAAAARVTMRYAARDGGAAATTVHRHAVELFAELAVLCVRWEPDPARREVLDEVLDSVRAIAPLFDERVLAGLVAERRDGPPDAVRVLDSMMRVVLELQGREVALDDAQRARLAGFLRAHLRTSAVERRAIDAGDALGRHDVTLLIEQLALARKDDPQSPRLECWAAQLLVIGDFLDEASEAIAAFHAVAPGDHPLAPRIARIQEVLDDKRKRGVARHTGGGAPKALAMDDRDIARREAELEHQTSSVQLYAELCRELVLADRWRDAHAWAARALAHCLTTSGQLRARELVLQLAGLEELAGVDRDVIAGFLAGARAQALPALDRFDAAASSPAVEYLRGLALLAADRRRDAQDAFGRALARCTRGIFLPLLRPLAGDVEIAVLDAARQDIEAALAEGRFRDALSRIAERMTSVARPAPYVLELARAQLAALLPALGTGEAVVAPPPIRIDAPWARELTAAIELGDAPARIRALCALATRVHEPSAPGATSLIGKLDELAEQLAVAGALERSIKLAAAGDLAGALVPLVELGPRGQRHARVLRHQAIVHLRLDQLSEADAAIERLAALADPLAREFAARYPALRCRQQLTSASALVKAGSYAHAREAFARTVPAAPDQHVDLAYCRAYCAAAEGYGKLDAGDRSGARALVFEALEIVEARLPEARTLRHLRLLELHGKLEADLAQIEEQPA